MHGDAVALVQRGEGRRKKEEGRRKKEEGRRKKEATSSPSLPVADSIEI